MAEQTSLRQFIPEPTTSLMSVEGLSGYTQQNPLPVDERDRQEAARELSRRGITAQAPVPSNQSVMAAPTSINPFNPAFRETARSALNDFFGGSNIAGREGYRTGRLVDTAVGTIDFAPVLGDAIGVGDLRQSISERDPVGIGINTIAMLPVIGDPTAKALRSARALGGQRQLNPSLDQSYEARMQRAREQGYKSGLYHGGVTDISQFDISRGTPETHMGMGVYTTTGVQDANVNYAGEGPDLTNRLERRAEEIIDSGKLSEEWAEIYRKREVGTRRDVGKARNEARSDLENIAKEMAREEIKDNLGVVYPLMGRSNKPFDISEGNDTFLSYEYPELDPEDYLDAADGDLQRAIELADDEKYMYEPEGELAEFLESIRSNLDDREYEKVFTPIVESAYDGGISGKELEDIYRKVEIYAEDDLGRFNQMEIFRQGLEDAGFDSIIHDANRFNMPNVEGEKHQIFFRENQLRSPNAEFDPQNIDSADLLSSVGPTQSTLRAFV